MKIFCIFFSSGSGIRTTRPPGYEPDELPLLYPAVLYPSFRIAKSAFIYDGSAKPTFSPVSITATLQEGYRD